MGDKADTRAALNGVRGLGAVMIVLYHMWPSFAYAPLLSLTAPAFVKTYLWLDLFFMLSGFALAKAYAPAFRGGIARDDLAAYAARRAWRLLPLHWLTLGAAIALEGALWLGVSLGVFELRFEPFERPGATLETIPTTFLLLQSWGLHDKLTWNIPAWYVSALVLPIALAPALIRIAATRNRAWILGALALAGMLALHIVYGEKLLPSPHDLAPFRALLEASFGVALGLIITESRRDRSAVQIALLVSVFILMIARAPDALTVAALAGLLIAIAGFEGTLSRWLTERPMQWLGERAFAIFMTHWLVLFAFQVIGEINPPLIGLLYRTEALDLHLAARFAVVLIVADWVYRWIERPLAARRAAVTRPESRAREREEGLGTG
ncbi:MAG: acyltransferase family protein [Alphaproteobacteria bacterium]|nr:acyltransferase family protein [Alphaproteobacteria bacterium]